MDKNYELKYHEQEKTNWWFVARRNIIKRQLKQFKINTNAKILDIGSSGGILSLDLINAGYNDVYSLDYSADAIELCKKRGLKNAFVMDGHNPDFPENYFDVIIASDCLEHLEDDEKALENWYKILKPGGLAIIYVPAFMFLWSEHDDINYHFRRYTRTELNQKLNKQGFIKLNSGYWNFLIFLPTAFFRLVSKWVGKNKKVRLKEKHDQLLLLPDWLNKLLINWVKIENGMMSKINFPFGVSTFSISKK